MEINDFEVNSIEISTYRDSNGLYLKIKNIWELKESYAEKLFSYQNIDYFLPMKVRCINDRKEYEFEITNKITLKEYLYSGNFTKESVIGIFREIFAANKSLEEYLLDGEKMQINPELVYLEKESGKLFFIYLETEKKDFIKEIRSLLELIMDKMDSNNKELVFFVYEMYTIAKEKNCTKNSLKHFLNEQENKIFDIGNNKKTDKGTSKEVRKEISKEIRSELEEGLYFYPRDGMNYNELRNKAGDEISNKTWNKISNRLSNKISDQINDRLSYKISNPIDNKINDKLKDKLNFGINKENLRENSISSNKIHKENLIENLRENSISDNKIHIENNSNNKNEKSNSDNKNIKKGIIGIVFAIAIILMVILYKSGIFYSSSEEGLEVGKLIGAIMFFGVVVGYGSKTIWES